MLGSCFAEASPSAAGAMGVSPSGRLLALYKRTKATPKSYDHTKVRAHPNVPQRRPSHPSLAPPRDEHLLKLVLDQHAQKLKKILEDEFSSIAAAAAIAPAPAPDAMDTSSDQPAAQQALERAKTKVAETCERHQEMVLQLFLSLIHI